MKFFLGHPVHQNKYGFDFMLGMGLHILPRLHFNADKGLFSCCQAFIPEKLSQEFDPFAKKRL